MNRALYSHPKATQNSVNMSNNLKRHARFHFIMSFKKSLVIGMQRGIIYLPAYSMGTSCAIAMMHHPVTDGNAESRMVPFLPMADPSQAPSTAPPICPMDTRLTTQDISEVSTLIFESSFFN